MHMSLSFAAVLAIASPASGQPQQAGHVIDPAPSHCYDTVRQARGKQQVRSQKLGELPPGDLSLAVVREVNGCPQPTVVRQGYGAGFGPRDGANRNRR